MATKKTTGTKKTTAQKRRKVVLHRRQWLFVSLLVLILIGAIYVFTNYAYRTLYVQPREARINEIYSSLQLPGEYTPQRGEVFGDKRVYDWDNGRSESSWIEFIHADTVDVTMEELDRLAENAGLTFIDEPYPGAIGSKQYHYKTDKGEYVRISVNDKPRLDAYQNFTLMNPYEPIPEEVTALSGNDGPSIVTIKVNLDDNNE